MPVNPAALADFVVERSLGWFPARWGGLGEIRVDHLPIPVHPVLVRAVEAPVWQTLGLQPAAALVALAALSARLTIYVPTPAFAQALEPTRPRSLRVPSPVPGVVTPH